MSKLPMTALEQLLCRFVKERYFPRTAKTKEFTAADCRFFAGGVAEVSASFTSERASLAKNYFNRKEYRSGYLLYFVLSNFPKAWNCLTQIDAAKRFADRETVRVLDMGAGPATASLAALEYWKAHAPRQQLACTAIDQNAEILADGRALFERSGATLRTQTVDVGWKNLGSTLRGERFDIIFAMNVLNEFGDMDARQRLITTLLKQYLTPNGACILIEPGLQRTTRALMELRDGLLLHASILAPCLHHDACPMRQHNQRDWCHFYLNWDRPKIIADLDQLIGNKKEYLKFSYLILTKHEARSTNHEHLYRVVSAPLRSKGKVELLLCPSQGNDTSHLHRIMRLDKDRKPANADLDRVWRGDIVAVPAPTSLNLLNPFDKK